MGRNMAVWAIVFGMACNATNVPHERAALSVERNDDADAAAAAQVKMQLGPGTSMARLFELVDAATSEGRGKVRAFDMLVICAASDFSLLRSVDSRYRVIMRRYETRSKIPKVERTEYERAGVEHFLKAIDGACEHVSIGIGEAGNLEIGLDGDARVQSVVMLPGGQ